MTGLGHITCSLRCVYVKVCIRQDGNMQLKDLLVFNNVEKCLVTKRIEVYCFRVQQFGFDNVWQIRDNT